MVGHESLDLGTLVRIQAGQPKFSTKILVLSKRNEATNRSFIVTKDLKLSFAGSEIDPETKIR